MQLTNCISSRLSRAMYILIDLLFVIFFSSDDNDDDVLSHSIHFYCATRNQVNSPERIEKKRKLLV